MLNWRRDSGYEKRMKLLKLQTEQIMRETEQPRLENAKLRQLNARVRELVSSAAQLCSAPECSSRHPSSTAPD